VRVVQGGLADKRTIDRDAALDLTSHEASRSGAGGHVIEPSEQTGEVQMGAGAMASTMGQHRVLMESLHGHAAAPATRDSSGDSLLDRVPPLHSLSEDGMGMSDRSQPRDPAEDASPQVSPHTSPHTSPRMPEPPHDSSSPNAPHHAPDVSLERTQSAPQLSSPAHEPPRLDARDVPSWQPLADQLSSVPIVAGPGTAGGTAGPTAPASAARSMSIPAMPEAAGAAAEVPQAEGAAEEALHSQRMGESARGETHASASEGPSPPHDLTNGASLHNAGALSFQPGVLTKFPTPRRLLVTTRHESPATAPAASASKTPSGAPQGTVSRSTTLGSYQV